VAAFYADENFPLQAVEAEASLQGILIRVNRPT
jgi:hypothetical protein